MKVETWILLLYSFSAVTLLFSIILGIWLIHIRIRTPKKQLTEQLKILTEERKKREHPPVLRYIQFRIPEETKQTLTKLLPKSELFHDWEELSIGSNIDS